MSAEPNVQRTGPKEARTGARKPHVGAEKSLSGHTLHVCSHDFPHEEQPSKVRDRNVQNVHNSPQTAETQRNLDLLDPIQLCDCGHVARIHGPTPQAHLITATECRACTCRNFTAALDQPDYSQAPTQPKPGPGARKSRKETKNG